MSWRSGGVKNFVMQRLTAMYIGLFAVIFLFQLFSSPPADFQQWQGMIASPLMNIAFITFWLAVMIHAWVGARDVIMDYVSDDGLRFIVLALMGLFLIFMAVWMVKILITVTL